MPMIDRGEVRSQALTIASVEAIPLTASFRDLYPDADVPNWLVHPSASHRSLQRSGQFSTLIRIRTTSGIEGIGECYGLPSPMVTTRIVRDIISPLLVGEDAIATDYLWSKVFSAMSGGGHLRGFYLEAMSGIDLALWDVKGKAAGRPVYELLGGPHRTSIPVYASPIPMFETVAESAEAAMVFVNRGFRAMKLKLGRGLTIDLSHALGVREAIGPGIDLLVDLNCAYTADVALRIGHALAEIGVTWFEEPLAVDDIAGYRRLRTALPLSLVNGETLFTKFDFREYFSAGAVDVVMPNIARAGGLTECVKIASLAATFHIDVAPHGVGSVIGVAAALQLSAAISNFRIYEFNQLPNPLRDTLATIPFSLVDGCLPIPTGPGLGIELDWERVSAFAIE